MARTKKPDIRETERVVMATFFWAMQRHGFERARAVFANYVTEANSTEVGDLGKFELLKRLDAMKPPNVKKLVRDLLAEQGIGPDHKRYEKERIRLDKLMRRVKNQYRAGLEAAHANVSPRQRPGEPAPFRLIKRKRVDISRG